MGLGAISWASKKQPIVTQSTIEAEYIATNATTCRAIWLRRILIDLSEKKRMEPYYFVKTSPQLHCLGIQSSMGEVSIYKLDITSSKSW